MTASDDLEFIVHCASRLASHDPGARQVIVVSNRRLTYAELTRCRQDADRLRLDFQMDGTGTMTLRRRRRSVTRPGHRSGWWRHLRDLLRRHTPHTASWRLP